VRLYDRYGRGPHRVEFTLDMPAPDNTFIVELAPVEKMPHSVHVFLDAVHHKFWHGKTFWLNAHHLLLASSRFQYALKEEGAWNSSIHPDDVHLTLSTSFSEYSQEYSHSSWTVGFAGRPGGPDFYINKHDNKHLHGPNRQPHHLLEGDADSCFGAVSAGFETLQKVDAMAVNEETREIAQPVGILKAVIL